MWHLNINLVEKIGPPRFPQIGRFDGRLSIDIQFIMVGHRIDMEKEMISSKNSHIRHVIYYYWKRTTIGPAIFKKIFLHELLDLITSYRVIYDSSWLDIKLVWKKKWYRQKWVILDMSFTNIERERPSGQQFF
jgi:hypothetical protein